MSIIDSRVSPSLSTVLSPGTDGKPIVKLHFPADRPPSYEDICVWTESGFAVECYGPGAEPKPITAYYKAITNDT